MGENDLALRLVWMRATLRIHAAGDVSTWSDSEVVESFAALRGRIVPFDEWAARIAAPPAAEVPEPAGPAEVDGDTMLAIVRATAPNVSIEGDDEE